MNLLGLSPIMIWLWLRLAFQPESFRLAWQNLDVGNVTWAVQVVQCIVACGCSMLLRIIKDAWGWGKPLGPKRLSLFSQIKLPHQRGKCVSCGEVVAFSTGNSAMRPEKWPQHARLTACDIWAVQLQCRLPRRPSVCRSYSCVLWPSILWALMHYASYGFIWGGIELRKGWKGQITENPPRLITN